MNTESLLGRIVTVVAVLIAASLVLSVVLGIIGGLIGLVFRFGIPLLLKAKKILSLITSKSKTPDFWKVRCFFIDQPNATSKTIIKIKPSMTPKTAKWRRLDKVCCASGINSSTTT